MVMVPFNCLPFTGDDAHAAHFQVPFLGLPGTGLMQTSSHWPFAHLTEAFNGIKPDVMLELNLGNHGIDGEHDTKGRKSHVGKVALRHHSKCPSPGRSRDRNRLVIEDDSSENCHDKAFAVGNLYGMQVYLDSRPAQVMEQARTAAAGKRVNHGMHFPAGQAVSASASTEMESEKIYGLLNQVDIDFWDYGFSTQPMPSMVSRKNTFQYKSPKPSQKHVLAAGVTQPSASCKLTLKKLPLKAPLIHVKVTPKENMDGNLGTGERMTKSDDARKAHKGHLQHVHVLKQLLCGGVAGVISRSVVAPLDLVKTYLITSHGLGGSQKSALSVFKEIVDSSGWQGLFRGNFVNCIRVAPNKAIELCVFEAMRRELNKDGHPLQNAAATIAGGVAGVAGLAATYPLELIRTRLSVQPELYTGILQATTKIFQEEGFMALYSGLIPSLLGIFPYTATNYFVYDGLRMTYCQSTGQQNVPTIPTLAFGAVAAAVSSTVTYPLEVARRQMQLSLADTAKKSSVGIVQDIYRHQGFLALYRGLGTTWLKLIPAAGISFVCYEAARLAMQIDDASMDVKSQEADEDSLV